MDICITELQSIQGFPPPGGPKLNLQSSLLGPGAPHIDEKARRFSESVNKSQKTLLFDKLKKALTPLKNKKIAIWGLSFKPDTDDTRDAPSTTIIKKLHQAGAKIHTYDPVATLPLKQIHHHSSLYAPLKDADALLVLTEWDEFRTADLKKVASLMKNPRILDGRNIFSKTAAEKANLTHIGIGL